MKTELIERARRIVDDNQLFINIVSKRVQQINHGADPYVPTTPEMGAGDIALMEIIEGKLQWREKDGQGGAEGVSRSVETRDLGLLYTEWRDYA